MTHKHNTNAYVYSRLATAQLRAQDMVLFPIDMSPEGDTNVVEIHHIVSNRPFFTLDDGRQVHEVGMLRIDGELLEVQVVSTDTWEAVHVRIPSQEQGLRFVQECVDDEMFNEGITGHDLDWHGDFAKEEMQKPDWDNWELPY